MEAKTVIHNRRLGREIGNRVFPNGFIETILVVPPNKTATKLLIEGVVNVAKKVKNHDQQQSNNCSF